MGVQKGQTKKVIDAGVRKPDHYQTKLPQWRFRLREKLIPIVRWETPILADFQERYRTPALDSYFAFTANLGTHTFFMIILPILFWSGEIQLARAMVNLLASGVIFSSAIKDMLCLPRPLSPPLQRINRSASTALEYGFPSTHSTNAVSVAVYALYSLSTTTRPLDWQYMLLLQIMVYVYVLSIVLGRLYCGMHGFFDVTVGTMLGAGLAALQCLYGHAFDSWILQKKATPIVLCTLIVLVMIRIHPEPADDCPCFDDSVAFAGVIVGVQTGNWHFCQSGYACNEPVLGAVPFSLAEAGFVKAGLRLLVGVLVIFAWRATAKPTLLKALPPLFRVIEQLGLSLPRAFYLRASQYEEVPPLRKDDDNVIPAASDIPSMISSLGHPRRRTISIGPQSKADVYEAIAVRQRKRRDSEAVEQQDGNDTEITKHASNGKDESPVITRQESATAVQDEVDEEEDRLLFQKLEKPRVRYDVEVVTKLIVYAGIGWLATEGDPVLFELIGLGMKR